MINELLLMAPLFFAGVVIVFFDKTVLELLIPIAVTPLLLVILGLPLTLAVAVLFFRIHFREVQV